LKWNYFKQFWSFIEIGIIVCSWTAVGIYVWRYRELKRIQNLLKQSNGYVYINFQFLSFVNGLLTNLFGFCCFFGTIRFLYLCRFSQRVSLFNRTLQYAGKELVSFLFMFSIVFISFVFLFYLLFNSKMRACSSLLHTAQTLFEMILLKFDAGELTGAASFVGPFGFSLFIILVVFVCLSMFLSIIRDSFQRACENVGKNNEELFLFMLDRFQRWIGMKSLFC
jgi:hypothetical protein